MVMKIIRTSRGKDTRTNYGFNYRMTEMQAAVGKVQTSKLSYIIEQNKLRYKAFEKHLPSQISKRSIPEGSEPIYDTFIFFVDSLEDKERYIKILTDKKFGTKNLPDAMEWHCSAFWDHALDKKQIKNSQLTKTILEKAIAVPIWLRKTPSDYFQLAQLLFSD